MSIHTHHSRMTRIVSLENDPKFEDTRIQTRQV